MLILFLLSFFIASLRNLLLNLIFLLWCCGEFCGGCFSFSVSFFF